LVCSESFKDNPEVMLMMFSTLEVDKDVVNEDYDKLIQLLHKYLIHEVHKKAGALVSPKGITVNSYCLYRVTNAVF
jgi:hypothetical protein